jgi:hypothetical protein
MNDPTEGIIFTLHGFIDINSLRPEQIDIRDIARGLATEYRYAGQTHSPYSVAEHSVLVSLFVPKEFQRQALLHDAAEGYFKDLPRVVKYWAHMDGYRELESALQATIFERFNVVPTTESYEVVSKIDKRLAISEINYFYDNKPGIDLSLWRQKYGAPLDVGTIPCLPWQDAEILFCARYAELFHAELPE